MHARRELDGSMASLHRWRDILDIPLRESTSGGIYGKVTAVAFTTQKSSASRSFSYSDLSNLRNCQPVQFFVDLAELNLARVFPPVLQLARLVL